MMAVEAKKKNKYGPTYENPEIVNDNHKRRRTVVDDKSSPAPTQQRSFRSKRPLDLAQNVILIC